MININNNNKNNSEIKNLIKDVEKKIGGKLFLICQSESIDNNLVQNIHSHLSELGQLDKITILINSSNGDIHSAYRIVNSFYCHTSNIEIIVVNRIGSAATFICLSSQKIYMSCEAELAPLDSRLTSVYGQIKNKSALNIFKSLEYLRQYSIEILNDFVLLFVKNFKMDIKDAVKQSGSFASEIIKPLYSKIDPKELGDLRRELATVEEYSRKIMKRYGYRHLDIGEINEIINNLLWNYTGSDYIIDPTEAMMTGLNVEMLNEGVAKKCKEIIAKSGGCIGFIDKNNVKGNKKNDKSE
ncbi:MAG: ATP-dependent Clp protease proteolytic subunit [Actinobacteria bacterium]|nr:ATP-dependent Clp protease proteolytic subunit [Actinomycetota bacterium]